MNGSSFGKPLPVINSYRKSNEPGFHFTASLAETLLPFKKSLLIIWYQFMYIVEMRKLHRKQRRLRHPPPHPEGVPARDSPRRRGPTCTGRPGLWPGIDQPGRILRLPLGRLGDWNLGGAVWAWAFCLVSIEIIVPIIRCTEAPVMPRTVIVDVIAAPVPIPQVVIIAPISITVA